MKGHNWSRRCRHRYGRRGLFPQSELFFKSEKNCSSTVNGLSQPNTQKTTASHDGKISGKCHRKSNQRMALRPWQQEAAPSAQTKLLHAQKTCSEAITTAFERSHADSKIVRTKFPNYCKPISVSVQGPKGSTLPIHEFHQKMLSAERSINPCARARTVTASIDSS